MEDLSNFDPPNHIMQDEGYGAKKNNTLEHILKSSKKQEAKLIGYDETPIKEGFLDEISLETLDIQEGSPASDHCEANHKSANEESTNNHRLSRPPISPVEAPGKQCQEISEDSSSVTNSNIGGVLTAKSHLFELCAANCWKYPVFECVKEEGPSHLKLFTVKVTVEIVETPKTILECFSEPRPKKKAAEEHAAEGAVWYLQKQGYLNKNK